MKKVLLIPLLLIALNINAQESKKELRIGELLAISGSGEMGKQVFDRMIIQFKELLPDVPEVFWAEAESMVDVKGLTELIIPIYDKYFTLEDIEGLIEFYKSPLGKKLVKNQPLIMQESMNAGELWGQELGKAIIEKLESSGY